MNKKRYLLVIAFVFACLLLYCAVLIPSNNGEYIPVPFSDFEASLNAGDVDLVVHEPGSDTMLYALFTDDTKAMDYSARVTYVYPDDAYFSTGWPDTPGFSEELLEKDVRVKTSKVIGATGASWMFVVIVVTVVLFAFFMSRTGSQKFVEASGGASGGAYTVSPGDDATMFSDIIGHDEIIGDIKFAADMLANPEKGEEMGVIPPKGMLLCGPPGTGKTMIARAIANEAGVSFISANASSFIEMYVGVGAKRIREVFKEARSRKPCVLFIDEIDAIGGKRSGNGRNSEDDKAVNALLQEMDGFSNLDGVFVIAATNFADSLDEALVRAGRFDRQVTVNPPRSWEIRKELFEHYLRYMKVSDELDLEAVSRQTSGFTGADIRSVCNEAGMIALMQEKDCIDADCIEEAIDKKVFKGNRSAKKAKERDRKIVAYHEAGHAVMTYLSGLPIARASIIGTTSGVGGAVFQGDRETVFMTRESMLSQVRICYAGRASEEIKFEIPTTGASNDITKATELIRDYVGRYGFDDGTGLIDMDVLQEKAVVPQETELDRIKEISRDMFRETKDMLSEKYDMVEKLALELLDKETMTGEEVTALLVA